MKKILVVDDNHDILELLTLLLEMEGYEVLCKDNGSNILDDVFNYNPDLILLDVRLGEYDGREICHSLKENQATLKIPIIMISATDQIDLAQSAADDFVPKPFEIEDLVSKVKRHAA